MATILRRDEGGLVVLGAITLAAWSVVALGAGGVTAPALCASGATWTSPSFASLDLFLALNPPDRLAAGWLLMLAAMTPPLLAAPLRHVRDHGVAGGRGPAMLTFAAGYLLVWMVAGAALQALALVLRMTGPTPTPLLGLTLLIALLWQASPAKQNYLNRCHERPDLTDPDRRAGGQAFAFGVSHGAGCVGACWALMLPPMLMNDGHLPAMAAVALFLFAERLERPATPGWRLRAPGKALWLALAPVLAPKEPRR